MSAARWLTAAAALGVAAACDPARPPCVPTTCEAQGKDCGEIPDGCGVRLQCGECTAPAVCGGGRELNVCADPALSCTDAGWCGGSPFTQGPDLFGVWGSGPDDVWVVGEGGTIRRWTGANWSDVSSGTTAGLHDVWGTGASDIWAAGDNGTILHWDGARWTPVPGAPDAGLLGIWGAAPDDVWIAGRGGTLEAATITGFLVHWDGGSWTAVYQRPGLYITGGLWGASATRVWSGHSLGMLELDGGTWTPVRGPSASINAISGSSEADVWATGLVTWHFDGGAWGGLLPAFNFTRYGAWAAASDAVWAAGGHGDIVRWDGLSWQREASGTSLQLNDVWASSPADVWVVGDHGTILRRRR